MLLDENALKAKYDMNHFSDEWNLKNVKSDIENNAQGGDPIQPLHYRPFDVRYTFFSGKSKGFLTRPRADIMRHLLNVWDPSKETYVSKNVALVTSRLTKGEDFAHVTVVDKLAEVINLSPNTSNNGFIFPLWLLSDAIEDEAGVQEDLFAGMSENISPEFRQWVDELYEHRYPAQEVFGYMYAVLHATTYRERYAEFLRIDFPRVPFAKERPAFERLSRLGWELAEAHLMRRLPAGDLGAYGGEGDNMVRDVRYVEAEQALYINDSQKFAPVSPRIWAFHIGGYQVLQKYLKDRRGRTHRFGPKKDKDWPLMLDEIENLEKVINILAFTVEQMRAIDEAYRAAFP